MRALGLVATLIAAVLAVAAQAVAGSGFTGNVCTLVSTKQAAPILGSQTAHCAKGATTQGPGSTIYVGTWSGSAGAHRLQVTVAHYTDEGALQLAQRNLKQGLPGGKPHRVAGIGSAAYEASGANATGLHFAVGKDVVYLVLARPGATAALEKLAKTVADRL